MEEDDREVFLWTAILGTDGLYVAEYEKVERGKKIPPPITKR